MSDLALEFGYCAWRLRVYTALKRMTYRDIDRAVEKGSINPSMSPEQVRVALKLPMACKHEFVDGHCCHCGYPGL